MANVYLCFHCDQPEEKCGCDKYCAICQGENKPRLWEDGQYYCQECREALDYQNQ